MSETSGRAWPATVGGYRVVNEISAGGMGAVLFAVKSGTHGFHKRVALKVILPHLVGNEENRALFLDEARLASKLAHPNVCQVFDFGADAALFFLAMEYVPGVPVTRLLELGKIDAALAARLIADAARGLHHAHTLRGDDGRPLHVVHRDVSPHNLIVTWDGVTKVLDFGIAKSREKMTATETGIVRGKPAYMSPEQATSDELDARSDVFSLGIVLYELVTGQKLFARDTPWNTLRAVVEAPIPDPREHAPDLPEPIVDAIRRALTRDPARRIESADALARLLDPIAAPAGALADVVRARFPEEHRASVVAIAQADELATQKISELPPQTSTDVALRKRSRVPLALGALLIVAVVAVGVVLNQPEEVISVDAGVVALAAPPPPPPPPAPVVIEEPVEPEPIMDDTPALKRKKPPPPPPPAPVAAVGEGTITVTAQPWGNVRIDGALVGLTPLMRHPVKAGPHVVEIVAPETGEVRARESVMVEANRESKVRAR